MNQLQKNDLLKKKKLLKLKLQVQDFIHHHITDWLPVIDVILENKMSYCLNHLACIDEEELPFWETALQKEPLANYPFKIDDLLVTNSDPIHKAVSDYYPTVNPIRYVPNLPLRIADDGDWLYISKACEELKLDENQEIIFFYPSYSPIIELKLFDFIDFKQDPIDFTENMIICCKNYDWMIYRTIENDWHWGFKPV